jgi:PleD family two-component response regulator
MTSQSGWQVTASIGVLTCTDLCYSYDALLGKADKLMYVAKENGKNNAEFMTLGGESDQPAKAPKGVF